MFSDDKAVIHHALLMWRNYIQTGRSHLSAEAAQNCGESNTVRMLNSNQQEFVIRLEELATKQLVN